MARQMNVDKRVKELKAMRARAKAQASKAGKIAAELEKSFGGKTGVKAKSALKTAEKARNLSKALDNVQSVAV